MFKVCNCVTHIVEVANRKRDVQKLGWISTSEVFTNSHWWSDRFYDFQIKL